MSDIVVTAVGWAATEPRPIKSDATVPYTDFRLGHSVRRFDGQAWTDGSTVWFTVKAFRDLARNVAESVHKGLPVVVQGRLREESWTGKDGQTRSGNVIEATAVGLNLARGASTWSRRDHRPAQEEPREDPEGTAGSAGGSPDEAVPPTEVDPWAVDAAADPAPGAADPVRGAEEREAVVVPG